MSPDDTEAGPASGAEPPPSARERMRRRLSADPYGLRERVEQLEADLVEARQLHLRVAELTDVVTELVVPLAQQAAEHDPERVQALLEKYQGELGT